MRILYIHNEKLRKTGTHHFNHILVNYLRRLSHRVDVLYPKETINFLSTNLKGLSNILFFYSLITKRKEAAKYDLIQGTTYTTLAFLGNGVPVITHFGSTTAGFLKNVPSSSLLAKEHRGLAKAFNELKNFGIISRIVPQRGALKDISEVELYVAKRCNLVVAASQGIKKELVEKGVRASKIVVIHNNIEDFWFGSQEKKRVRKNAGLVYSGRMGEDSFTIRLKGITRLIVMLKKFPKVQKTIIGLTEKSDAFRTFFSRMPNMASYFNLRKKTVKRVLGSHYGDIYINPGRYEGFCLSLVEAMSQGLIPVVFPIGVAPEIIQNGRNGYIVNNLREMTERIEHLLSSKDLRKRMAKEAEKTAQQFRPDRILNEYIRLYRRYKYTRSWVPKEHSTMVRLSTASA